MSNYTMSPVVNGEKKQMIVKVGDTSPIGLIADYDGSVVPDGWEQIDDPNTYSTDETRIGTWIDGKPLYRKVYNFGTLPNNTIKSVNLNITNLGQVVEIRGICKNTNSDFVTPIPIVSAEATGQLQVYIQNNQLRAYTNVDKSGYTQSYIIVEYTKTTD